MRNSMIANVTVKKQAALATGIGIGPLSLRLFVLGIPIAGSAHDSVLPLALWLTFSLVAQFCAAVLVVGGIVGMAGRRLGWIRPGAARRRPTRTRPRGGASVGLAAYDPSCRLTLAAL